MIFDNLNSMHAYSVYYFLLSLHEFECYGCYDLLRFFSINYLNMCTFAGDVYVLSQ